MDRMGRGKTSWAQRDRVAPLQCEYQLCAPGEGKASDLVTRDATREAPQVGQMAQLSDSRTFVQGEEGEGKVPRSNVLRSE